MKKVFLVLPHLDKGYTLQVFHGLQSDEELLMVAHKLEKILDARMFIQGHYSNGIMLEFWTSDNNLILEFCERFSNYFQASLEIIS